MHKWYSKRNPNRDSRSQSRRPGSISRQISLAVTRPMSPMSPSTWSGGMYSDSTQSGYESTDEVLQHYGWTLGGDQVHDHVHDHRTYKQRMQSVSNGKMFDFEPTSQEKIACSVCHQHVRCCDFKGHWKFRKHSLEIPRRRRFYRVALTQKLTIESADVPELAGLSEKDMEDELQRMGAIR